MASLISALFLLYFCDHSMPLVLIDAGNSHIKWCYLEHTETPLHTADIRHTDYGNLAALAALSENASVYISMVANPERSAPLRGFLAKHGHMPHVVTIPKSFDTAYSAELGIDRYLAMRAAAQNAPCIVADMGTALTVDMLNADGHHAGGFITLGLRTHLAALAAKTSLAAPIIPAPSPNAALPNTPLPNTTKQAITHGTTCLYTTWLDRIAADYPNHTAILTGTDGAVFCEHLPTWQYRPALVLEGLADYAREHQPAT